MDKIRLHKYLSQSGICSRRKAEEYIQSGHIFVNGQVAEIGQSIDPEADIVTFHDEMVRQQKTLVYYKINKPRGIVTTCAQHDERSILDIVDIPERVFPIGRLDKDTTGLILLTSDGRLANFLMHPRYEHQKEYIVETFGPISDDALRKMEKGVYILGSYTKHAPVKRLASGKFSITLSEGRNRQIRRMVESVGSQVKKLKRIRIENIHLGDLKEREYLPLSQKEKKDLFEKLGIS